MAPKQKSKANDCNADIEQMRVECGVALPIMETDFPVGTCGSMTSADPRVFGPDAWKMLHYMGQWYPTAPSDQAAEACVNFINALPYMLPAPICAYVLAKVRSA